ncbi:MAG: hypothetical protein AAFS03_08470 [Pseudomonadota bacterium]
MFRASVIAACLCIGACQVSGTGPVPAHMADTSEASMEALKAGLAQAMGTARVTLGASDLEGSSTVAVLPAKPTSLEGRSPAVPILFDLMMDDTGCMAIRQDTGETHTLPGLRCVPA